MDGFEPLTQGRVSRRQALQWLALAGAWLTACAPAPAATPTESPGATATPSPGPTAAATSGAQAAASPGARGRTAPAAGPSPTVANEVNACVPRPETTEGPFFIPTQLERSDLRGDPTDGSVRDGVPLALAIHVAELSGDACTPAVGAQVDLWHCDAAGVYSGFGPGRGRLFLRGYQMTDANGVARFTTIYPGWYSGRTVHIHIKVRGTLPGDRPWQWVGQLFFDDALTDEVFARPPYSARGPRNTTNATDGIFRRGGDQLLLSLTRVGEGYQSAIGIGVDLATAAAG